jgi:hypothetical protein
LWKNPATANIELARNEAVLVRVELLFSGALKFATTYHEI